MGIPYQETVDGYEIQWQVWASHPTRVNRDRLDLTNAAAKTNYISHWLLTNHLIPILQATSKISEPGTVRIVCLSSGGHMIYPPKEGIRFEDTGLESASGMTRYGQSKLGNVLHAKQLHARYGPKGNKAMPGDILTSSVNPGNYDTYATFLLHPLLLFPSR